MTTETGASDFEKLLCPHFDFIYRIAYRFTGNRSDAQDLSQELLIKLYPRVQELKEVAKLRPWLIRVLYRIFLDGERKQRRSALRLVVCKLKSEPEEPLERIACPGPNPEQCAQQRDLSKHLARALDQLGKDQRAVITLHDIEGYPLVELEALLEVPLGTLKSRLHRARAILRQILEKQGTF